MKITTVSLDLSLCFRKSLFPSTDMSPPKKTNHENLVHHKTKQVNQKHEKYVHMSATINSYTCLSKKIK